jgi:hypothetical protein
MASFFNGVTSRVFVGRIILVAAVYVLGVSPPA